MSRIQKIIFGLFLVVLLLFIGNQIFLARTNRIEGLDANVDNAKNADNAEEEEESVPAAYATPIIESMATCQPPITGADPGVMARIAENSGNIKVLQSRLDALSGLDSKVASNTNSVKDLQLQMKALSESQTQALTGQFPSGADVSGILD